MSVYCKHHYQSIVSTGKRLFLRVLWFSGSEAPLLGKRLFDWYLLEQQRGLNSRSIYSTYIGIRVAWGNRTLRNTWNAIILICEILPDTMEMDTGAVVLHGVGNMYDYISSGICIRTGMISFTYRRCRPSPR